MHFGYFGGFRTHCYELVVAGPVQTTERKIFNRRVVESWHEKLFLRMAKNQQSSSPELNQNINMTSAKRSPRQPILFTSILNFKASLAPDVHELFSRYYNESVPAFQTDSHLTTPIPQVYSLTTGKIRKAWTRSFYLLCDHRAPLQYA